MADFMGIDRRIDKQDFSILFPLFYFIGEKLQGEVEMIRCFIYKITNNVNQKIYIGMTSYSIKKRWAEHLSNAKKGNQVLYKAMRKYGKESFSIDKIDKVFGLEEALAYERAYIECYGSFSNGYNSTLGGEGVFGYKPTQKQIEKSRNDQRIEIDKKLLYKLYIEDKLTVTDIGIKLNLSQSTISLRLKDYGIPTRSTWEIRHKKAIPIEKKCKQCGNTIPIVGHTKSTYDRQRYCSKECGFKAMQKEYHKICLICGIIFTVKENRRKYCSRYCSSVNAAKARSICHGLI